MATIGVLTYTLPPGLKLNTNFIKQSPSQQQTNFHNNNSTIITKIEDISMFTSQMSNSGEVVVMRKKQKLNPLQETANNNNNNQNKIIIDSPKPPPAKKQKLSVNTINTPAIGKNMTIVTSLPLNNISNIIQPTIQLTNPSIPNKPSTPIEIKMNPQINNGGKKSQPLPQAVARRNARERNRVKQVNNGFAQLRQRIPDEVAEAFEAAGNGRGTAKKLSKVETLRMAVEYIRSLENILGIEYTSVGPLMDMMSPLPSDDETSILMNSNFMSPSADTVIKTEYCSSPPTSDDHERFDDNSLYDPDESSVYFTDNLPDVTTINGQQYLRIPGTNTYQLIALEIFENEENIHPLITSSPLISTPSPNINYIDNSITGLVNSGRQQLGYNLSGGMIQQQQQQQQQQISPNLINTNNTPALISPDQYSNNSIGMQSSTSPAIIVDQHIQQQQQNLLSQMQMHQNQLLNQQENHNELLLIKTEHLQQQQQQHQQQQQQVHTSSPVEIIKMNYNQLAPNSSPLSTNDDENQGYSISSNELQLYDGVMTLKHKIKIENECNTASILLDNNNSTEVNAAAVAGLSDESMMEAIDWWEAHTPKSEQ